MEIRSPVLTSMSYSRGGWILLTLSARWIRSSVVLPMALTTATTSIPSRRVRAMWSATARMRSASPTEVPRISGRPPAWHDVNGPRGPPGTRVRPRLIERPLRGDRVSGRAQRQESPSAGGREMRLAQEAKAKKRRKQIRNAIVVAVIAGVIILIVFLTSSNSAQEVGLDDDHDDHDGPDDHDHHGGGVDHDHGAADHRPPSRLRTCRRRAPPARRRPRRARRLDPRRRSRAPT